MSWLRSSPLRQSSTRGSTNSNNNNNNYNNSTNPSSSSSQSILPSALRQRPIDTATDCDPRACYDSFCKHWQQAYEIIQRSKPPEKPPSHDDVLGVVSHLDYMVTLLLVELHHCNKISLPSPEAQPPPAPCLEFMLSENLLDKLYEWGCSTGRYANAVRLEQLKLYELLVSHSRHQLLCHEPFLRPLLKILASSQGEIYPPDLEKRLVILLNQLCVLLMQNVHLLDLFFFSAEQEQHKHNGGSGSGGGDGQWKNGHTTSNFIIFSLLIPYVHREGSLGHQARDALLLCMALSQKNSNVGTYIAQYSSMCPLLVTGLGGLYSRLPNSIEITSADWHRITPDDVTEIAELTLFMNALEFCNAVVQVAHEMIKEQLLDFMYQGFIVPVLGPAILQTLKGKHFQTNIDSQISAMSYLDLILRSVTEPGLLRAFVRFLLDTEKFDGERILDTLIDRLTSSDTNLCMVAMALFDTLLGLHCEDLMLELLLKYLLPGKHVPISHRHKINAIDPYTNTVEFLLDLTPDVMKRARELTKHKSVGATVTQGTLSPHPSASQYPSMPSPTSTMSKTIGANWNYYGLHSGESLYANFHAYLFEAHYRIEQCQRACKQWANSYRYQRWPGRSLRPPNTQTLDMVKQFFNEFGASPAMAGDAAALAACDVGGGGGNGGGDKKQLDSLQSLGESSGYESFKWRPADEDGGGGGETLPAGDSEAGVKQLKDKWRESKNRNDLVISDLDFSEDLFAQGTVSLGPFLNAIWRKLETFTSNSLYVNFHLTGLITRLAWYPLPLIHSLLLRPDIVITSDTPSFHQVLRILKQQIDAELPVAEDSLEIVDIARSYLIDREFRLINVRKASENSPARTLGQQQSQQHQPQHHRGQPPSAYAQLSSATPVQVMPSSSYDPFKRNDSKRKSLSKSITSMFSRKTNGTNLSPFSGGSGSSNSSASATTAGQEYPSSRSSSTHETSLTTLPPPASGTGSQSTSASGQHSMAFSSSGGGSVSASSGQMSLTPNASLSSLSASSGGGGGGGGVGSPHATGSTSTLSTLTSTLMGGSSGVGGSGGNSEPVSLESLPSMGAIANTSGTERTRDLALCALLLDEWLKELAAIAQEQSIVLVNDNI